MKNSLLTCAVTLLIFTSGLRAQNGLLAIDSLHMQSLEAFYLFAEKNKDNIWPGMKMYPICLYRVDGPAFLYNHPDPPSSFQQIGPKMFLGWQNEQQLTGATQTEINGVLTAITGYQTSDWLAVEDALSVLFHELHHVYQRLEVKNLAVDNPAILMVYPGDAQNDALKIFEQNLLYQICFTEDQDEMGQLLNLFFSSRQKRRQIIGDFLDYEILVENNEGPAYYCEYQMHRIYSSLNPAHKKNYYHRVFWSGLTTPYYGRQYLRYRHLSSGFALCMILDRLYPDWKKTYYTSGKNLQDILFDVHKPTLTELPDLSVLQAFSSFHTARVIAERKNELDEFYLQSGIQVSLHFTSPPQFRGFDPMNAQAVDPETIIHKTMLRLARNANQLFIHNSPVVTRVKNQVWFVDKLDLFVPEAALEVTEDNIRINDKGIHIQWSGQLTKRDEHRVEFQCD